IRKYIDTLLPDGTWQDIDYADEQRSGWKTVEHLGHLKEMSFAYANPKSSLYNDENLLKSIYRGLDHWLAKRYQNSNWWWNEIGVPRAMRDIEVLLNNHLDEQRRNGVIEVIGQYRLNGTGANLMWAAELALHHGCLTENSVQVTEAVRRIVAEINVGAPEGIQDDNSYFQHSSRLQVFHYGKAYLDVVCKLAWQLRDTPWALPDEKREIVSDYIVEGVQWMCRGTYTVPGTMDRMVSRKNSLQAADMRPLMRLWREVDPRHKDEIDAFLNRQESKGMQLTGFRHYPRSDFTVYHRPGFSFFVKTISNRTLATEAINNENLKGQNLHSGDHYLLRDGDEYNNLQPVWNWEFLPGVTLAEGAPSLERRSFVGGIGNGTSGLCAMDYSRITKEKPQDSSELSVRKLWAFHNDIIICLLSGWNCKELTGNPYTALDQCRQKGPVWVGTHGGNVEELHSGKYRHEHVEWIYHNGIAYAPLKPVDVTLQLGPATGSWHSINWQYGEENVTEPVFLATLNHKAEPSSSGFVIAPGTNRWEIQNLLSDSVWQVVRNDAECQCLKFDDGLCMAAFYSPGAVEPDSLLKLSVNKSCLALWTNRELWVCDPTNVGCVITATWRETEYSVELPPGGQAKAISIQ
ncbi:MAG: chondroitin AC lyase, partial [Candidatus Latescibacteria bacterium]|nr:chondroitin AC lyase [Candidatus Latescibacterota bacterium]